MPILHVRNVPEDLYQRLRQRAEKEHRSLSAEVVRLLEAAVRRQPEDATATLDRIQERRRHLERTLGPFPSSTDLLREDRAR